MVSKPKKEGAGKKKKIKVLNLNRDTVKDLKGADSQRIKGGLVGLSLVGVRPQSKSVFRSRHTVASRGGNRMTTGVAMIGRAEMPS